MKKINIISSVLSLPFFVFGLDRLNNLPGLISDMNSQATSCLATKSDLICSLLVTQELAMSIRETLFILFGALAIAVFIPLIWNIFDRK